MSNDTYFYFGKLCYFSAFSFITVLKTNLGLCICVRVCVCIMYLQHAKY